MKYKGKQLTQLKQSTKKNHGLLYMHPTNTRWNRDIQQDEKLMYKSCKIFSSTIKYHYFFGSDHSILLKKMHASIFCSIVGVEKQGLISASSMNVMCVFVLPMRNFSEFLWEFNCCIFLFVGVTSKAWKVKSTFYVLSWSVSSFFWLGGAFFEFGSDIVAQVFIQPIYNFNWLWQKKQW